METNYNGMISNIPTGINKEVPTPKSDAKEITRLIKESGDVIGYELENQLKVTKSEGIQMAKMGEITGVAIATNKGNEYLRSLPDGKENNNLGNLPSIANTDSIK